MDVLPAFAAIECTKFRVHFFLAQQRIDQAFAQQVFGEIEGEFVDEFVEIFEEEKEFFTDCCSIGDGHEISDKYEYFASVYQNMILDYSDTKSEVPKTVEYIEDCLSRISIFDEENLHPAHLEGHPLWIT